MVSGLFSIFADFSEAMEPGVRALEVILIREMLSERAP